MSEIVQEMRLKMEAGDAQRDADIVDPAGLVLHKNIPYGPYPENLLDVYYPEGATAPLPTIISVHGGAWYAGSKDRYAHYCLRLAARGFAVVNFDYRLAPEYKYPAPVEDTCKVLSWVLENAKDYCIDPDNLFTVGDSAGGQISFQVLTMLTNPKYAALFPFSPPAGLKIKACGMNCGCYFMPVSRFVPPKKAGKIFEFYFPEDYLPCVPSLQAHKYITKAFPPAFVTTAPNDYLRLMARPFHLALRFKGVESILRIYGTKEQKEVAHVFHLNCRLPLAKQCNDEQCDFFRKHIHR